jgi:hypothetical protein
MIQKTLPNIPKRNINPRSLHPACFGHLVKPVMLCLPLHDQQIAIIEVDRNFGILLLLMLKLKNPRSTK